MAEGSNARSRRCPACKFCQYHWVCQRKIGFQQGSQNIITISKVAAALMEKAGELFAKPPSIEMVDVLAAKLPG